MSRFHIIAKQHDFRHKSVLDLGCRFGNFKPFLDKSFDITRYTGIDKLKFFIDSAKKRHLANCHFIHADFSRQALSKHDIVIASGSLNYRSSNPNYLNEIIDRMYLIATNEAVIFNLLDATTFPQSAVLENYSLEEVLQYCQGLTKSCYIAKQTIPDNFTVV